jgi:hypothetical protein
MTQHYLTAQKAIDGLRLSFKNNKKAKPVYEKLHPSGRQSAACDCCATVQARLTTIDSGQKLCHTCLQELRG